MPSATMQDVYAQLEGVQEPLRSIAAQIVAESNGAIGISSGHRTTEHQAELWQEALQKYGDPEVADNWVARPGTSHHERGMAVDFSGDMSLLAKLASKHGLMQPMDNEAWHWELGDGADYEGQQGTNMPFDTLDTPDADPREVLANRMNAVLSIIGGNNGGGYMAPMDQNQMWMDAEAAGGEFDQEDALFKGIMSGAMEGAGNAAAGLGGVGAAAGRGAAVYQKYAAKQLQQKYGLGPEELPALIELWNRESNWDPNANNTTSSAAGIAQKMTSIHGALENTWQGQIDWGLDYIMGRYKTPSAALQWHNRHNWY